MKKRKKADNRWLCYVGLIILFTLLLAPPLLRWFGKDLFVREEIKRDEVIILSCTKQNEDIRSAFLNGVPQNIEYRVKGDYSVKVDEETNDINQQNNTADKNSFMKLIKSDAQIEYDNIENVTTFKIKTEDLRKNADYLALFGNVDNQQKYFDSQAFYCDKVIY